MTKTSAEQTAAGRLRRRPPGGDHPSWGGPAKADAPALLALIVGEDEIAAQAVTVKPLRDARAQQRVGRTELAQRMTEILKGS